MTKILIKLAIVFMLQVSSAAYATETKDGAKERDTTSIEKAPPKTVAIPEPGTFALFGLGLAGLVFARRKSKQV